MCVCGGSDGAVGELLSFKSNAIANTTAKNHCCHRPTTATIQRNANAETCRKVYISMREKQPFCH